MPLEESPARTILAPTKSNLPVFNPENCHQSQSISADFIPHDRSLKTGIGLFMGSTTFFQAKPETH